MTKPPNSSNTNIQYCSDLHLEFSENKNYVRQNPLQAVGDILILAGDVVPFPLLKKHDDFFTYVSDHFQQTYWIPGNHEYYHSDLADRSGSFFEKIKDNVFLINNYHCMLSGVKLIFSTLWTTISIPNKWNVQQGLSDFHVISYKENRFTPDDYNEQHAGCISFIKRQLNEEPDKTIVVTHHVPTLLNYPEQYKGDVLNEAFAVELFDLIEASGPDYWIYGHHHQNVEPFQIGNTQLVTNQLGYVRYNEHLEFDRGRLLNLKSI